MSTVPLMLMVDLLSLVKSIWKYPHRCAQEFASQVVLNILKFTEKSTVIHSEVNHPSLLKTTKVHGCWRVMLCYTWFLSGKARSQTAIAAYPAAIWLWWSHLVSGSIQVDGGEEWSFVGCLTDLLLNQLRSSRPSWMSLVSIQWMYIPLYVHWESKLRCSEWHLLFFFPGVSVWKECAQWYVEHGRANIPRTCFVQITPSLCPFCWQWRKWDPWGGQSQFNHWCGVLEPSHFHKTWACEVRSQEARHLFHSSAWVCSTWGILETQATSTAYLSILALKSTPKSNGLSQHPFTTFHCLSLNNQTGMHIKNPPSCLLPGLMPGTEIKGSDLGLVSSFWVGWVTLMISVHLLTCPAVSRASKPYISRCLTLHEVPHHLVPLLAIYHVNQ